jgi:pteridine reductase
VNQAKIQDRGVALVTGAARRIGAAIARALHVQGFDVVLHCHQSADEAHALADALNQTRPDSACVHEADLTQTKDLKALIQHACTWHGRLDVLVNNASCFIKTVPGALDEHAWDTLWAVNVKAPFWLSEHARDALAQTHGCIVNITDIQAEKPRQDYAVYVQTKAALKMQTEALALTYAPSIRVNAVAPGATMWPEGENALSEAAQADVVSNTPLKRHGEPQWVSEAVLSLVLNQFITGQTLRVDGGRSLV